MLPSNIGQQQQGRGVGSDGLRGFGHLEIVACVSNVLFRNAPTIPGFWQNVTAGLYAWERGWGVRWGSQVSVID